MKRLRVFLVDDEQLALNRLRRLLEETGSVDVIGETTKPKEALRIIPALHLDAVFLDIQMPELTGFELLQKLGTYPPVVFTTAYDEFALKAFEVYALDYLLKPVEVERLDMALQKLFHFNTDRRSDSTANIERLLETLTKKAAAASKPATLRIASRIGGKIQLIDIASITHFLAEDKLTFAQDFEGKRFPVDQSLNQLETDLDTMTFLRIHRGVIVNLAFVGEVHGWFSGKVMIRLKDRMHTELVVARNRVRILKLHFGI